MKLSDKILNLRKQRGMSQEDLAEKLDVSRQAVSRWEVGTAQPDASNVLQLSSLFGVTADYLLNDDYESDHDVPAVKNTEISAKNKIRKVIALCASAFGLFGNFVIYILSCFISAKVPVQGFDGWIIFDEQFNYFYFIKEHNLIFIVVIFWLLFAAGLIFAFVNKDKLKEKLARKKKKNSP